MNSFSSSCRISKKDALMFSTFSVSLEKNLNVMYEIYEILGTALQCIFSDDKNPCIQIFHSLYFYIELFFKRRSIQFKNVHDY